MLSQALKTCCFGLRRREETTAPSFVTPPATAAKPGDCPVSLERTLATAHGCEPPGPRVRRTLHHRRRAPGEIFG
eukprot:9478344-Pyramimonas_sp.AAC.1